MYVLLEMVFQSVSTSQEQSIASSNLKLAELVVTNEVGTKLTEKVNRMGTSKFGAISKAQKRSF